LYCLSFFQDEPRKSKPKHAGPRLPVIMYKEGEPLHALAEYLPKSEHGNSQCVEIRIPVQFVTSSNRQVRSRQLWGSDVYTSDSDLVAVLMHYGYIFHTIPQPIPNVAEIRVVVRPLPSRSHYVSTARNAIRSRAWASSAPTPCAYSVDKAWVVTRTGNSYDLRPNALSLPLAAATFAPSHLDRMMTRSAVGPSARQRLVQEMTVLFNLANEPWIKYSPSLICDRGLKPHEWTAARLHTHVLYLESPTQRYEVCKSFAAPLSRKNGDNGGGEGVKEVMEETFTFSRCKRGLSAKMMRKIGIPLPPGEKKVEFDGLSWEDFKWGMTSVVINGKAFEVVRIHFMRIEPLSDENTEGMVNQ
jgi:hypothetical protein